MSFNNPNFLTVEDYNSIVSDLAHGWIDYYDVIISDMEDNEVLYCDFLKIIRYSENDTITYEVEVLNTLWTGGYCVEEVINGEPVRRLNEYDIVEQGGILFISGFELFSFKITLELSNDFIYANPQDILYKVKLPTITAPYYETGLAKGQITNIDGSGVGNISIYYNNLQNHVNTDNNGYYQVPFSKGKPGKSNVKMSILKSNSPPTYYNYYFIVNRLKVNVPVRPTSNNLYKDSKQYLEFEFKCNSNITSNELFNENTIYLLFNNKKIVLDYYDGYKFGFLVDLRDYYDDTIDFKLVISGNDYIEPMVEEYTFNLDYYVVSNYNNLKSEIEKTNGFRTIKVDSSLSGTQSININREIHIIGTGNVSNNLIKCTNKPVFIVNDKLTLENCRINGITQNNGSIVNINNCKFENISSFNGISSALHCNIENDDDTFVTVIKNSEFSNCRETCIYHGGDLTITNSSFSKNILDENNVAFINQVSGSINLNNNVFNLNIETTNVNLGCIMFHIGLNAKINNVLGKKLKNNENFPLLYNKGDVCIVSSNITIMESAILNKCVNWIVENTNTIYSNNMEVNNV